MSSDAKHHTCKVSVQLRYRRGKMQLRWGEQLPLEISQRSASALMRCNMCNRRKRFFSQLEKCGPSDRIVNREGIIVSRL
jgi:hypothetical protein